MRQPGLFIVTGKKGVGKSYTTEEYLNKYIISDRKSGFKGRPVLIFDINDEYGKYKAIDYDVDEPNDIIRGKPIRMIRAPKIYRIKHQKKNGAFMNLNEKLTTSLDICSNFADGLMLFEDILQYAGSNLKRDFIGQIISTRHRNVDAIIHYQSLAKVPPTMWENLNYIRMHKQNDKISDYRNKIKVNYELVRIAQLIVDYRYQHGDQYYYIWIDIGRDKLTRVTKNDFIEGCKKYLGENTKEIKAIQSIYSEKDTQKAIELWIEQKMDYIM